jgi:hypothetical protein
MSSGEASKIAALDKVCDVIVEAAKTTGLQARVLQDDEFAWMTAKYDTQAEFARVAKTHGWALSEQEMNWASTGSTTTSAEASTATRSKPQ